MYRLFIRPLLFLSNPESVHHFVFACLRAGGWIPGLKGLLKLFFQVDDPTLKTELMGLTFSNPVGLAAGFDKDARCVDMLGALGFGFIEVGTLTPLPQPGNPKPRLFRIPKDQALINRMGFNNDGADAAAQRLRRSRHDIIVGGNLGKNKVTPNEQALDDYLKAFHSLYPVVDYFVINVSSPNTPGLRALQEKAPLLELLSGVIRESKNQPLYKPVLLKVSPDLTLEQLNDVVDVLKETGTDGVIATNTTLSREGLHINEQAVHALGAGGLSGKPLREKSTQVIRYLRSKLGPAFPIIGVGGIMSVEDALEKISAGANLVQLYTGFIYEGPGFARRINRAIAEQKTTSGNSR